ncbi:MAG: universal stress protein [Anaerolineales bacterium]|nr:MAG: universal stress protein [Anaerolineales bacterium]
MYKKILVPLDGSETAELALEHAIALARAMSAEIILLHVIDFASDLFIPKVGKMRTMEEWSLYRLRIEQAEEEITRYLGAKANEISQLRVLVSASVVKGYVVDSIINQARVTRTDLIVIASHGRSNLKRVFYGSVCSAILQKVDRPLLVVRDAPHVEG